MVYIPCALQLVKVKYMGKFSISCAMFVVCIFALVCCSTAAQPKISLDRLNSSQPHWAITMDEDANITMDGGFIKNIQSDGVFNILAYGATPDDYTDDASAIQDCYDAATASYTATGKMQVVYWPPGEFNGNTSQYPSIPSTIIRNRPGVITQGAGIGATVFRAADNFRNTTQGVYMLWNEDEYCAGMQIRDITFEFGNNTVESGESNYTVGMGAYWTSDVVIENVEILNTSGFWSILLGGMAGHTDDCKNALLRNIHIYNSLGSSVADDETYDQTAIRINMDNVVFSDSILENEAVPNNAAMLEFHGNNTIVHDVIVLNYTNFANLGVDCAEESYGQVVSDCYMAVANGINLWNVDGGRVINFTARNNEIVLLRHPSNTITAGFQTINSYEFENVTIVGNTVTSDRPAGTGYYTTGCLFHVIENLIISDNRFVNCANPILIYNTQHLENCVISDNIINKFERDGLSQYKTGIYVDAQLSTDEGRLYIKNNILRGTGSSDSLYGILVFAPNLTYTVISGNEITDITGTDITTTTPYAWQTDEVIQIDHRSYNKLPLGAGWSIYADDGSTWLYGYNSSLYRMDTTWKIVNWTYV